MPWGAQCDFFKSGFQSHMSLLSSDNKTVSSKNNVINTVHFLCLKRCFFTTFACISVKITRIIAKWMTCVAMVMPYVYISSTCVCKPAHTGQRQDASRDITRQKRKQVRAAVYRYILHCLRLPLHSFSLLSETQSQDFLLREMHFTVVFALVLLNGVIFAQG